MKKKKTKILNLKWFFVFTVTALVVVGTFLLSAKTASRTENLKTSNQKSGTSKPSSILENNSSETAGNPEELEDSNEDSGNESASKALGLQEKATVVRVIDGDTFEIENGQKVRLIGINAPEKNRPYFEEAKQKLTDLVLGREVVLKKDISETDKYNRLLRYVYLNDSFINLELVRQGFAVADPFPPDIKFESLFRNAAEEARNNHRGLWNN